ncbi:MAG: cyclic nucleotide-binding domain-containing protein [Candidatus Niyogibacteria bacterium]|nr:cyclic nucleotide-binding domain-containing protein [Candidatus Niyogibacteria bacterium]
MTPMIFKPGDVLFKEGEPSPCMYYIVSGNVKVVRGNVELARNGLPSDKVAVGDGVREPGKQDRSSGALHHKRQLGRCRARTSEHRPDARDQVGGPPRKSR